MSPKRGEVLFANEEKNSEALNSDPYAVTWIKKNKSSLVADVVGHVPREISRFVHFFLRRGGKVEARVYSERYIPSPIASGGLEIVLSATFKIVDDDRRYLNRLIGLITGNYKHDFGGEQVDFTISKTELPLQEVGEIDNEDVIVFFDEGANIL